MQVSQQDQFITHAVVGNQESVSMGVSDDAALMHILSSTLYTYPQLAVVREIVCNAWDAHIAAGLDRPVEITLTDTRITIRDYGFGIAHSQIGPIYGTYGNSTKRDDNTVTGGFGLGSKAPFAYTDNFEVISHHLGEKTVYRVSKSSMEKGGRPSINKIVSLPTMETGISVSFDLQPNDRSKFQSLLYEVLQLGEIPATLNGEKIALFLPMSASPTGYLIHDFKGTLTKRINLRYGNVVYPIPEHEAYAEDYARVGRAMSHLWPNASVIFMAPPDSISIAPSRENVILTDGTVATIAKLLASFEKTTYADSQKTAGQVARTTVNQQIQGMSTEALKTMLRERKSLNVVQGLSLAGTQRTFSTFRKAGLARVLESGQRLDTTAELVKKLRSLVQRKEGDVPFLKRLIKVQLRDKSGYERRKSLRSLLTRHIVHPLNQAKAQYPSLEKVRTWVYQCDGGYAGTMFKSHYDAFRESNYLNQFLEKRALIARNIKDAEDYLDDSSKYQYCSVLVWVVGHVKEADQRALDIMELMEKLGYEVDVDLPDKQKKVVEEVPGEVVVEKKPSNRRKQGTYLTLAHSYDSSRNFLLSHARSHKNPQDLITDPVAYTVLWSKSEGANHIEHFSKEVSRMILKEWGTKIAVVTPVQAERLQKQGVKTVTRFLLEFADDKLSQSRDFRRFLAFGFHGKYHSRGPEKLLHIMSFHPQVMQDLNLRFSVSKETAMLIALCTDRYRDFSEYPKCNELAKRVKAHPQWNQLREKLRRSPLSDFVCMESICLQLEEYSEDHEKTQAAYTVIQLLLK